ncbi:MAG: ABC transporter ATP-binding protein [Pseudomonadota bacterium]
MVGSIIPFLTVLSAPETIETNTYLSWIHDSFGFSSTHGFLVALGLGSILVIVVASLIQMVRAYAVAYFAQTKALNLSTELLRTYLSQPYEFFLGQHTGEMGTKILAECQTVVGQFYRPAANIIASLFSILAILGLLLWVNPGVTIVCLAVLTVFYGSVFFGVRRRLQKFGEIRITTNKLRYRIANEALSGIKEIKLLGREANYLDRFAIPAREMTRTQIYSAVVSELPGYFLQGIAFAGIILLSLVLLGKADLDGGGALGEIVPLLGVFAFAGQRLIPELQRIYLSFSLLQYGSAALLALHGDLKLRLDERQLEPPASSSMGLKKHLELVDVTYRYPNAKQAGLSHVSLKIAAGEKVGIVGSTGAGKTTLADLLLGLILPESGEIRVDGSAVTPENRRAWQRTVGYVPQDIYLIDATIIENIGFGLPRDRINTVRAKEACRIAQLDNFIESELPHGYDTMIGERGIRLSGGQRQRIGIARALYHDAEFFVFDEATSALDNLTESEVMSAINSLPGDKTVLLIAHRLSTLRQCDRIIVLDQGRLAGSGSWDELMKSSNVFQRMASFSKAS